MIEQSLSRLRPASAGTLSQAADSLASPWLVQCDFDGTISLHDVTDTLLQRFGRPGWEALEAAWELGEIGSRECMAGQIALLDMSAEELEAHLHGIAMDPHFAAFVALARDLQVPVQVVSDGMDVVIRQLLAMIGLDDLPVIANRLVQVGERSWRLDFPYASDACKRASGNCKCERLAEQRVRHDNVLFVGDSTSDFCVSGEASFVLAKYRLIDHCVENGIDHAPIQGFADAVRLLPALVAAERAAA
jgi:2,3-diketo-5-methylthio-1-phosphopentane phosphatase